LVADDVNRDLVFACILLAFLLILFSYFLRRNDEI